MSGVMMNKTEAQQDLQLEDMGQIIIITSQE
jgi:hypothetical protein